MQNTYCRMSFIGRFNIPRQLLCEEPDLTHFILSSGIILRAEALFHEDAIEYIMYSPTLFREIDEGEQVPHYVLEMTELYDEEKQQIIDYIFTAAEVK